VLLIRDVYPGSRIRLFSIPDPGSHLFLSRIPDPGTASQNLSILTKKWFVYPGSGIRIVTFYPSRIPDPEVKKAPDPGSATLSFILKTALSAHNSHSSLANMNVLST
jgi:hypothetical protein